MSISKDIEKEISKKTNYRIHHIHISNIIFLLLSEMIKELLNGNQLYIENLFTISFQKTKPRKYHNLIEKKMKMSAGKHLLKFKLPRNIKKIFTSKLVKNEESGEDKKI